ncbi:NAD-P-binding protein [Abortiporus biennis]|nr:NAD-P-binding protein [Abortiporus biennis]
MAVGVEETFPIFGQDEEFSQATMSTRVWVITGCNSGLGRAIALEALKRGDKVIGTFRSRSKFPESLREAGVHPIVIDFSDSDDNIVQAAREAIGLYGNVDVLVNNAAYSIVGPVEELRVDDIRTNVQVTFFAVVAFTQPFITHFRKKRAGHILNISTLCAFHPFPSWLAYTSGKAALDAFTETLTHELKLFNVRVVSLVPGYFSTNIFHGNPNWRDDDKRDEGNPSTRTKIYTDFKTQGYDSVNELPRLRVSQGRIGDPEKLAMRVYKLVTGTGLLKDLVPENGGRWEWNRIHMGSDCGEAMQRRLKDLKDNVDAMEEVWRSTDVEPDRLQYFPRG